MHLHFSFFVCFGLFVLCMYVCSCVYVYGMHTPLCLCICFYFNICLCVCVRAFMCLCVEVCECVCSTQSSSGADEAPLEHKVFMCITVSKLNINLFIWAFHAYAGNHVRRVDYMVAY